MDAQNLFAAARLRQLCQWLPAIAVVACAAASEAGERSDGTPTHYTQGTFCIPFQVQPGGRCPQSLDLMVSRDQGRTWQVHQTAAPAESAFEVVDADEGEFLVKVQARDNLAAAVSRSLMKLVVDRTAPQLDLTCDWHPEGGLQIRLQIDERYLDASSISIELTANPDQDFQPLHTKVIAQNEAGLTLESVVTLAPCETFAVRVSASDRAGNRSTHSQRFRHPALPSPSIHTAQPTRPTAADSVTTAPATTVAVTDWSPIVLQLPQAAPSMRLTGYALPTAPKRPVELTPPAHSRSHDNSDSLEIRSALEMNAPEIVHSEANKPALSYNHVPRVVSYSRRLTLGYEFPDASLAGPSSVELWGSTDQGQKWTYWGNDQDCQSPCRVEVDRPGEYHFRIVRLYRAEDQALRPGAGDSADIIVVIPPEKKPVPAVRLQPIDG